MIKIACVGDIMPGGVLHGRQEGYVSEAVLQILSTADLRIGTLECAIGDAPDFDPEKMRRKQDVIWAPNADLFKLKKLGIDCVSLANNHAFDLGSDGLTNTIARLDELGIAHCGAGRNLYEASKPAVFHCNGKSIAFFAFCDYRDNTVGYVPMATADTPGMNPMYKEHVQQLLRTNRARFDYLFVIPHWGREHTFFPIPAMKTFARLCIQAGADGVIGGHTHRIQPLVFMRKRPVFYSLGNFLFPDRYLNKPRPTYYPAPNEDTSKFPITDGYPYVEEPTFKIWKPLARIGMIGELVLDERIIACYTQTYMTAQNVLDLCPTEKRIRSKAFKLAGILLRLPVYGLSWWLLRIVAKIKSKLLNSYKP